MTRRLLASIVVVVLAAFSMGTATAWFADSATLDYSISAAPDFDHHHHHGKKVWVCVIIGDFDDLRVKPGKNPVHVSKHSRVARDGFSDDHPSYVVDRGDTRCQVPSGRHERPANVIDEPAIPDEAPSVAPEETSTTTTPATTTTSTSPDTTTSTPATTTTTTTAPTTTVTAEDPSTTSTTTTVPPTDG